MEISDGKQAENGLKRPKRSKNEAKKRSSAVWEQDAASSSLVIPTKKPPKTGIKTLFSASFCKSCSKSPFFDHILTALRRNRHNNLNRGAVIHAVHVRFDFFSFSFGGHARTPLM